MTKIFLMITYLILFPLSSFAVCGASNYSGDVIKKALKLINPGDVYYVECNGCYGAQKDCFEKRVFTVNRVVGENGSDDIKISAIKDQNMYWLYPASRAEMHDDQILLEKSYIKGTDGRFNNWGRAVGCADEKTSVFTAKEMESLALKAEDLKANAERNLDLYANEFRIVGISNKMVAIRETFAIDAGDCASVQCPDYPKDVNGVRICFRTIEALGKPQRLTDCSFTKDFPIYDSTYEKQRCTAKSDASARLEKAKAQAAKLGVTMVANLPFAEWKIDLKRECKGLMTKSKPCSLKNKLSLDGKSLNLELTLKSYPESQEADDSEIHHATLNANGTKLEVQDIAGLNMSYKFDRIRAYRAVDGWILLVSFANAGMINQTHMSIVKIADR